MAKSVSAKPKRRQLKSSELPKQPYGRGTGVPNPIDLHVGKRIRLRRRLLDMNQTALAHALDLTFQQIQKYELGMNRVSASRLSDIATVLGVPISFFFANLLSDKATLEERKTRDQMEQSETIELVRLFHAIPDPELRQKFLEMVKAAAASAQERGT